MSAHEPTSPPSSDHKRILEALLFVSDEPVTVSQIGQILRGRGEAELRELIGELDRELAEAGRALKVEEVAGGFRFSTRSDLAPWIRLHYRNRNRTRLSGAGIETLAVIAYKQPVTAPEIQEIRGVDSQGPIRTLLEKRLVRTAGRKKVVGRPFLYATTKEFLIHFGLASIDDLPPIEDFEKLAGTLAAAEVDSEAGGETTGDAGEALAAPDLAGTGLDSGEEGAGEGVQDLEGAGEIEDGLVAPRLRSPRPAREGARDGLDEEE